MQKLNNGAEIPLLGLGVYQSSPGKTTENAVRYALKIGYRHIDTAYLYSNESDVENALHESGPHRLQREEAFITSKMWNSDQRYDTTFRACKTSLRRLILACVTYT
jgi:methylglyoxal/glyoxal reductase